MIRNQFSYWLTAKPVGTPSTSMDGVLSALNASVLAMPDGPMVFSIVDGEVFGEVNPEYGTVAEDTELSDIVTSIAARFPDYEFEFTERDEDDHSKGRMSKYADGKLVYEGYIRTLDPDEYDKVTLDEVMFFLRSNGYGDAADAIAARNYV